ncbi:extracellular solute-binding protein [Aeromicrobium sp. zg-636]|uniref:Extracellular solute-binding protein n=1 Tax=Aeromicrobium senzhongii TaxID=2663859 RepID=A0A8I0ET82_9ACTN|nr:MULTISPECIES: extracellular solute-binding protein [Aeromicrobium]MBC9225124.1 extracellular solute-binding protein [Aeromicrobium senzhongii]
MLVPLAACASEDGTVDQAALSAETCLDEAPAGGVQAGTVVRDSLKGETLTFAGWGGEYTDAQVAAFVKPFEACSGAKVAVDMPTSFPKLQAMVESGNVLWDVVYGLNLDSKKKCADCLLEIDTDKVDISNLSPTAVEDARDRQGALRAMPIDLSPSYLLYSEEKFKSDPPSSPEDFFDVDKYPGKRMLIGDAAFPDTLTWTMAARAAGFTDEQIAADFPFDEAAAVMEKIRTEIVYAATSADQQQQLEQGRVAMASAYLGRAYNAAQNTGSAYVPIDGTGAVGVGTVSIPRGSKNVEAGWALLNFMAGPAQQSEVAETQIYSPANLVAEPSVPESMKPYYVPSAEAQDMLMVWSETYGGSDFVAEIAKHHADFMTKG